MLSSVKHKQVCNRQLGGGGGEKKHFRGPCRHLKKQKKKRGKGYMGYEPILAPQNYYQIFGKWLE